MIAVLLQRGCIAPDTKVAERQAGSGTCCGFCGNKDSCHSTEIFLHSFQDVVCSLKICPLAYSAVSIRQLSFELRAVSCCNIAYCLEH
jgi:hypothetical protein